MFKGRQKRFIIFFVGFVMAKSTSSAEANSPATNGESRRLENSFFTFNANGPDCKRAKMSEGKSTESSRSSKGTCSGSTTFIALHLGAGKHSLKKEDEYKSLCKHAISKAVKLLNEGGSAGTAVANVTAILEDCGFVNAGCGSNLTYDKTVECDAAFMNGNNFYGAVGALPGVRNPIFVAKKLADLHEEMPLLSCGRVPPNFLVGAGARNWAQSKGIPVCDEQDLISKKALHTYKKYMGNVEKSETDNEVNDTVGAIALDQLGNVAATVSSGGSWLKFPGRIGHAPMYGCGCWASNSNPDRKNDSSVALSLSGSGEILTKARLAQSCGDVLKKSTCDVVDLSTLITNRMAEIKIHKEPAFIGLVALKWDGFSGEFMWGHNSDSFVVSYGGSSFKHVKVNFTKSERTGGGSIALQAIPFR